MTEHLVTLLLSRCWLLSFVVWISWKEVCIGYNIPEGLQLLRIKKNKALPAHRTTRPTNQAMTNGLCKTGCMRGGSLGIIIAA